MSATLRDELRVAARKRDELAARLKKLQAAAVSHDRERQLADAAADAAANRCRDALGARAAGEDVDVETARAERDAAASHLDDLVESGEALESKIDALEIEHEVARRAAAQVMVRVAVALAGRREMTLRAAAAVFARAKREWHMAAATAAEAHHAWSGQIGIEPIVHTGFRAALLVTSHDDGLKAIFGREGLTEGLQPVHIRGLTERELLCEPDDETALNAACGAIP